MGPSPLPRVPGGGRGLVSQCCSVGGPAPPRASLCKAPAPARSASARGEGQERGLESVGEGSPAARPQTPLGAGAWPRAAAPRSPPTPGRRSASPLRSAVLARRFLPRVLPRRPGGWALVRGTQASRRPPAAHTVLSSIHSVLVKASRALAEPSPRSPSSPAAPPPAPSRCGVDRWRFVRRARRG